MQRLVMTFYYCCHKKAGVIFSISYFRSTQKIESWLKNNP